MRLIVFCDIDGVLADNTHRLHYALEDKDYNKYYSDEEVAKDTLIYSGYELVRTFINAGADVHFVSARNVRCREVTAKWIHEKIFIDRGLLAMRDKHDWRPSPMVKVELIQEIYNRLAEMKKDTLETQDMCSTYFIDDDLENVKAVCEAFPNITGITFGVNRMEAWNRC